MMQSVSRQMHQAGGLAGGGAVHVGRTDGSNAHGTVYGMTRVLQ